MKTLQWVALVVALALAFAVINWLLGESILSSIVAFSIVILVVFNYLRGGGNWLRTILGALISSGLYVVYLQLSPAETPLRTIAFLLFMTALLAPFLIRFLAERREPQHEQR